MSTLREWAGLLPETAWVTTTQKDFVKLRVADLAGRPVRAVRVGLNYLRGETDFRAAVNGVV